MSWISQVHKMTSLAIELKIRRHRLLLLVSIGGFCCKTIQAVNIRQYLPLIFDSIKNNSARLNKIQPGT
jgi:hypothetical protein